MFRQAAAGLFLSFAVLGSVSALAQVATGELRPTLGSDDAAAGDATIVAIPSVASRQAQPAAVFSDPIDEPTDPDDSDEDDDAEGLRSEDDAAASDTLPGGLRLGTLDQPPLADRNVRARRAQQVGLIDETGTVIPLANTPARPVQGGATRDEEDPYAPLGIRAGTFLLFPTLTQTLGYTSNADASAGGEEAGFSLTEARLAIVSDWALHELRFELSGSYQTFFNDTSDDVPVLEGSVQLRLDHQPDFTSTFGASVRRTTESATSDNLSVPPPAVVTDRPDLMTYSAFAETRKRIGLVTGSLRGSATRSVFGDADLSTGGSLSQADRDSTLFQGTLRLTAETGAAFRPFVEAGLGARIYDESVDRNGIARDSMIYALRGGLEIDRGDKLNGEIAVGYSNESFDDGRLADLGGLTLDGTINWSPWRLTTITATAQTSFTPSTDIGESGSVTYAGSLGISRDVRPNLTLNARILASLRDYEGSSREDETWQATAGAEWRLNRSIALVGQIGYETVDSTDPSSSYDAYTARIGLRLQR